MEGDDHSASSVGKVAAVQSAVNNVAVDKVATTGVDTFDAKNMGPPPKPKRNWTSSNKYLFNVHSFLLPEDKKKLKKSKLLTNDKIKKEKDVDTEESSYSALSSAAPSSTTTKDKETNFICHLCKGSFSSQSSLQKHAQRHTGIRPFECTSCEKSFFTKFSLNRHTLAAHEPSQAPPVLCNICDKRFSRKEWLYIHLRSHTGETPFNCGSCEEKFTSQINLNRHILSTHKTEKSFLCFECGKTFQTRQSLRVHLESHVVDRQYNCDKCRMRFKRRLDLQRHGLVHREVPMLSCPLPQCEHQFRRKDNLLRHLQLTHDQTREEAHETFNLLDTSCKSSRQGSIRDNLSEVGNVSCSTAAEDSESTQDSTSTTINHSRKTTKVNKNKPASRRTNQSSISKSNKAQLPKKAQVTSKTRKRQGPRDNKESAEENCSSTVQNVQEMTPAPIFTSQISTLPQTTCTDPIDSPKKSVTTSVIRLVKSSPSVQPIPRKRQKRSYCEFSSNYNPEQEESGQQEQRSSAVQVSKSPPPPQFQTLLSTPAPYPSRNPSPGQEYINYLNSLNNPVAFRVRDRSSSFGTLQNRQNNNNPYNSSELPPQHGYCYDQESEPQPHRLSYRSQETGFVNFTNVNLDRVEDSTLHLSTYQNNNSRSEETFQYNSSAADTSSYFHQPQFHPSEEEQSSSQTSVGYLDLSSSDPEQRRISFEPLSSHSLYHHNNANNSRDQSPSLHYTENDYQQQKQHFGGSGDSSQSNDFNEEYCNVVPLGGSGETCQNQNFERPCNVTVIKRASASTTSSQNQNYDVRNSQNHQEFIQNFMQPGQRRRLSIETGPSPAGSSTLITTITLSEDEETTFHKSQQQQSDHHHDSGSCNPGGKDMIVNRDPRKNFLHRENFSRNRNQD